MEIYGYVQARLPIVSAMNCISGSLSGGSSRKASLVDSIRARIEPLGGIELEIAPREAMREPVALDR